MLVEEQYGNDLNYSWVNKGVDIFPKSKNPKVNLIAWLEFELAWYNVSGLYISHYVMRTSLGVFSFIPLYIFTYQIFFF